MIQKFFHTAGLFFLLFPVLSAQTIPITDNNLARSYSFIHPVFNTVQYSSGLDSFYYKLHLLKKNAGDVVSIVHIGDSHIQADFLSGVVREGLQQYFGNAGRGLVFPYQLAQSNAPPDISSSSNTRWQFNRVAHPEIPISYGISGYGIKTNTDGASVSLSLRPDALGSQAFSRLRFFLDSNHSNSWMFRTENMVTPFAVQNDSTPSLYKEVVLDSSASSFSMTSLPSGNAKELYGVSLENSGPGILYHTIGVNGARYDHYNKAALFWKQLTALNADLFIISLGTNEAQALSVSENIFRQEIASFIEKLKAVSPGASILIASAADSYKRRRLNLAMKQVNHILAAYCEQNNVPFWDLYRITNGHGSAYNWSRRGLMNRDRIHFTAEGYRVQGLLLFNALAKGYNSFISTD
ncbi:MAG: hypothetical protein JNK14_04245 [Chitinophagaceae bacterium]|nr:hypothetical protein [Chitinophagaceae bacterium]